MSTHAPGYRKAAICGVPIVLGWLAALPNWWSLPGLPWDVWADLAWQLAAVYCTGNVVSAGVDRVAVKLEAKAKASGQS